MASQKLFIDIVARDRATRAMQGLQGGLAKLRGAVFNLQNAFLGLGAGLVIRNLVSTGRELENLQVRLRFLLKDTNEGAKAFDNMVKFASRVPFSLEEIQSGSGILATVTDNAKDLQNMLEITGNVAAVTGLDFRTTAEQIQRSFSAGIGAADLFREKGVRNMLGFKAGATVSIEETVLAFEKVFGRNGRFGQATDDLAKTFEGTMSMLGDKVFSFKKTLLDAGFFSELKRQFGDLDKFLVQNSDSIERIAIGFGTVLAKAVRGLVDLFKILKENINGIITAFKILIAIKIVSFMIALGKAIVPVLAGLRGIAALSGVGLALVAASVAATTATFKLLNDQINKTIEGLSESIDKNIALRTTSRELAILNREYRKSVADSAREAAILNREFEKIKTTTEKIIEKFEELNKKGIETLRDKIKNIAGIIAEGIDRGITKVSEGIARSIVLGEKLSDTFKRIAQEALIRVLSGLIEMGLRIAANIALTKIEELFGRKKVHNQNKLNQGLKQELALRSAIAMFGGGFGFGIPFFAKGGAVSKGKPVVVGERGPELFVPNQTGQITQSARGTGGEPVTVNFNINTVDASGFDELLARSRGTITQIINSAVNERGREALI